MRKGIWCKFLFSTDNICLFSILIGNNEIIKISDFGTARQFEHSTKMSFAGTCAWMAPEIIRNEPYSEKVNILSISYTY